MTLGTRLTTIKQTVLNEVVGREGLDYFWEHRFIPRWFPLILGVLLGTAAAFLIFDQAWQFVIPLAFLVPAVMLFNRYPFISFILWFLITQYFVNTGSSAGRFIFWLMYRALPPMTLLIVLLSSWLGVQRKKSAMFGRGELLSFLFLLAVFINALIFTEPLNRGLIFLYDKLVIPISLYWMIRLIAPDEQDLRYLIPVAFITILVQSTIGLMQWFTPQLVPLYWMAKEGARTTGTLNNPAVYTSLLTFSSVLLFQFAMQHKDRWPRTIFLPVVGLALACGFFSFSRSSWLGLIIVIFGLMIMYPIIITRSIMILMTIMLILAENGTIAAQIEFAYERLNSESTAESRVVQNVASLRMVQAKPLTGWGWHNYDLYDRQFHSRVGDSIALIKDQTSHNTYLTMLAELGIPTFLLYISPFFWWIWLSLKTWRRMPSTGFWGWPLLVMLWLVFIQISINSFFNPIINNVYGTSLLWITLGFIGNMVQKHMVSEDIHWYAKSDSSRLRRFPLFPQ
jgi:O-antigen ligase